MSVVETSGSIWVSICRRRNVYDMNVVLYCAASVHHEVQVRISDVTVFMIPLGIHHSGSLTIEGEVEVKKPALLSSLEILLTLGVIESKSTVVRVCGLLDAGVVKSSSSKDSSDPDGNSSSRELKKTR
jgi:hypothetical protein